MVSQLCLMYNCQTLCLGARPRYSLVVDEDVKKPNKQTSDRLRQKSWSARSVSCVAARTMSDVSLGTRPRYSLVAAEDVKKSSKQTNHYMLKRYHTFMDSYFMDYKNLQNIRTGSVHGIHELKESQLFNWVEMNRTQP